MFLNRNKYIFIYISIHKYEYTYFIYMDIFSFEETQSIPTFSPLYWEKKASLPIGGSCEGAGRF